MNILNEEIKEFSELFIKLTSEHQQEVLNFMEFLYLKTIKEIPMHPILREELLERKKEGLENVDKNFSEKEVYMEVEALFEI